MNMLKDGGAGVTVAAAALIFTFACKSDDDGEVAQRAATESRDKADDEQGEAETEPEAPPRDDRLSPDERLTILDGCFAAMNEGDAETFVACYTDDAELEIADAVPELSSDPATVFADVHEAFSDLSIERQLVILGGSTVATLYLLEGTHDGPLWGIEPTEEKISVYGGQVAHLNRAGEITRDDRYLDQATIRAQLGDRPAARAPRREAAWPEPVHAIGETGDPTSENFAAFNKGYFSAAQDRDVDAMVAAYAEGAERRIVPHREPAEGSAAIRRQLQGELRESPDTEIRMRRQWGAGDWLVVETHVRGTMENPPEGARDGAGESWEASRLEFFEFEDASIRRHLVLSNELGRLASLGVVDAQGADDSGSQSP